MSGPVTDWARRNLLTTTSLTNLLTNLGSTAISTVAAGSVFYVNSADGSSANNGTSWASAKPTIEEAIQLCTANSGDVILVAPYHNEGAGDAQIFDLDIAGVSIIGLGEGTSRPILDFDHANTVCSVGAADCTVSGLRFRPSVTGVLIGVDVETGITGTNILNCEWMVGEDGAGVDEFVKALHLTSGNHDTVMKDLVFRAHVSAAHATHGIHVDAASNRCVFNNIAIYGPYATNGILEDAASADTIVENCNVVVTGTNYGFVSTSTFARFFNNRGAESRQVNKLGQEFYPGLGYKVSKTEDVNTATSDDLFTLTGKIDIGLWTMEVTNALGAAVTDYSITLTTLNGVLLAAGNIASGAIGFIRTLSGSAASTALNTSTGAVTVTGVGDTVGRVGHYVVGKAGGTDVIKAVRTAGDASDAIIHSVFYMPLETGASLVTAA